ncbi:MAG TPA: phosphotransferase [Candidatus Angelobacter sp.]
MGALSSTAEPAAAIGTDLYQLVLMNSVGTRVLLQRKNRARGLPEICIPRFTRPAEQITSWLRTSCDMKAVLLWSGWIDREQDGQRFAVLEALDNAKHLIPGWEWFGTEQARAHIAAPQARLIEKSQARALKLCLGTDPEPFSRLGWLHRLRDWIIGVLQPLGTQLGDFSHFNGSASFSLIRFETDSKPLWFKAVGAPNLHEFPITLLLSRLFPAYLPRILASDPLLNGWLMESGGELTLFDCQDLDAWTNACRCLAELQIASLGRTAECLQVGCRDLRLDRLASLIASFFDTMAELMSRQTKHSPAALTSSELSENEMTIASNNQSLANDLQEALGQMAELSYPDALGHADFNPGNVLVDGERTVFTDWAEAYVGCPFLTCEYFLAHLGNSCPSLLEHEGRLRDAYLQRWIGLISERKLRLALNLSPLIAPYVYAISSNAWADPKRLADSRIQGSLRSLTRRMKREADSLHHRRKCETTLLTATPPELGGSHAISCP